MIAFLKKQKQQWCKIVDYSLYDISHEASGNCFIILIFHFISSQQMRLYRIIHV